MAGVRRAGSVAPARGPAELVAAWPSFGASRIHEMCERPRGSKSCRESGALANRSLCWPLWFRVHVGPGNRGLSPEYEREQILVIPGSVDLPLWRFKECSSAGVLRSHSRTRSSLCDILLLCVLRRRSHSVPRPLLAGEFAILSKLAEFALASVKIVGEKLLDVSSSSGTPSVARLYLSSVMCSLWCSRSKLTSQASGFLVCEFRSCNFQSHFDWA